MRYLSKFAWRYAIGLGALALMLGAARADVQAPGSPPRVRTVTDEVGRRVEIPARIKRIVSLAPNLTEIVYALGAEDRLAGDTNYCDTPPEAKSKPHVGSPQEPNLEAIIALHPDLVLASTSINRRETADALQRLGIPVFTSDPHTVLALLTSIARTASLIGAEPQGDSLVAELRGRLDSLQARMNERPLAHVLFVVWLSPLISIGENTFLADALRWAGAESVVLSDQNWPQVSMEEVVRLEPDYIVMTAGHEGANQDEVGDLHSRTGWKDLEAVKLGRVVTISDEVDRPAPGLIDAIEELAHELHPEAFASDSGSADHAFNATTGVSRAAAHVNLVEVRCIHAGGLCAR